MTNTPKNKFWLGSSSNHRKTTIHEIGRVKIQCIYVRRSIIEYQQRRRSFMLVNELLDTTTFIHLCFIPAQLRAYLLEAVCNKKFLLCFLIHEAQKCSSRCSLRRIETRRESLSLHHSTYRQQLTR